MPDTRQQKLITAAEGVIDAGAEVVSIIARYPDGDTRTLVRITGNGENLDPWKAKRKPRHSEKKLNRLVEIVSKS